MHPLVSASAVVLALALSVPAAAAPTETVIHNNPDGNVWGGVVAGKNGVVYGVVTLQNRQQSAYVFSLTPPGPGKTTWGYRRIYTFPTNKGYNPADALVMDSSGALYGTAFGGDGTDQGIIFRLTPPAPGTNAWTETTLYAFPEGLGPNGSGPTGSLLRTANGDLYGGTLYFSGLGGCPGNTCGEVFRLSPPPPGGTAWSLTVLYTFLGQADGGQPNGGLVKDASGAIYGTTRYAGLSGCNNEQGCGTVFKLTPPAKGEKGWNETTLYSFTGGSDGGNPNGGLVFDRAGTLYGTTVVGGLQCLHNVAGCGVAFTLSPPVAGQSNWTASTIYLLQDDSDGWNPVAGLTPSASGTYLGATEVTASELTPPQAGQNNWGITILHNFSRGCVDDPDVSDPTGKLVRGVKGALFGAATDCGAHDRGGVFEITP